MKQFIILLLVITMTLSILEEKETINPIIESQKSDIIIPTNNGKSLRLTIADGSNAVINTAKYMGSHPHSRSQHVIGHTRHRSMQIDSKDLMTSGILPIDCKMPFDNLGINDFLSKWDGVGPDSTGNFTISNDDLLPLLCVFSMFNEYILSLISYTESDASNTGSSTEVQYYDAYGVLHTGDSFKDDQDRIIGILDFQDEYGVITKADGSYDESGAWIGANTRRRTRRNHLSKNFLRRFESALSRKNRRNRGASRFRNVFLERKLSMD